MERVQEEIRTKIIDFLKSHKIKCDDTMDYRQSLLTIFDLNRKWIPTKSREVVYSNELKAKMENELSQDKVDSIKYFPLFRSVRLSFWRVLVCAAKRRSRIKTSTRHGCKLGIKGYKRMIFMLQTVHKNCGEIRQQNYV